MTRTALWMGAAATAVLVALAIPRLASAQPTIRFGEPTRDPKAEQIKSGLEKKGQRVIQIGFQPAKDGRPPGWGAVVAAEYVQPSFSTVVQQGTRTWDVMYGVIGKDNPALLLFTGQVWSKHMIVLFTATGNITTFLSAYGAAKTDEERNQASSAFLRNVGLQVADLERGQFVDQKDFVNKNFAR